MDNILFNQLVDCILRAYANDGLTTSETTAIINALFRAFIQQKLFLAKSHWIKKAKSVDDILKK